MLPAVLLGVNYASCPNNISDTGNTYFTWTIQPHTKIHHCPDHTAEWTRGMWSELICQQ